LSIESKNEINNDDNKDSESIMRFFNEEVIEGENGIIIYPNLQSFSQIYTKYAKEQLEKEDNSNMRNEQSRQRIILIATFYETVDSIKHHLNAAGVQNIQSLIDNGSLVIVDAFSSYYPDVSGMKKLVASLSERAKREGRAGVTAIVDMGFFFLFGGDSKAADLISYEASLAPKTQDGNVKGISCYHRENYETLTERDKELITQGRKKKLLDVKEIRNYA
jgi:DcmR-like sensory protein